MKKGRIPKRFKAIHDIAEELKIQGKVVTGESINRYAMTVVTSGNPWQYKVDIGRCAKITMSLINRYLREFYVQ